METKNAEISNEEKKGRSRFIITSAIAVILVCAASAGIVLAYQMRLQKQTGVLNAQVDRGPHVLVETIHPSASARSYEVPITIRGYIQTPIYAKIPGYLKTIYVDKGDRVKKGQVVAILESPETDKEVADALANYKLQTVTYDRYWYLYTQYVVPRQTADNWEASMLEAKAIYQQDLAMQAYEVVHAPVREDIRWNVWLQLWGNICFSPISALTCTTLDRITADAGLRALCKAMMAETQAVNEAHGIHIPSEMADRRLAAAASTTGHKMSMLQDLERDRSMEIDPIVTAVQELGRLAGVKTPVIDVVLALVQERARVAGLYPADHAHLEQAPNAESQDG